MSPAQTEPIVESMNESSAPGDPFAPLAAAFLHIEDSAIVFSAEGELVVWNPGAERLYGYTFEEARDPPPLNWSTVYFSERRIKDGNETTQTRRDSLQATAS